MSKVRYTQQLDCGVRLFPGKESLMVFEFVDNTGHRYSARKVKKMIRRQKDKYGWEFLFLGPTLTRWRWRATRGSCPTGRRTTCDSQGTRLNYEVVGRPVQRAPG